MAANAKQGTYLSTSLIGFTALAAGLVTVSSHSGLGWLVTAAGLGLLALSTAGFVKLKQMEVKK